MNEELKKAVCHANIELQTRQLIIYSWGNVSGIDRSTGIVAIKPSGVAYDDLTPDKIVLLDLDGKMVEGKLKPSSSIEVSRPSVEFAIHIRFAQPPGHRPVVKSPASALRMPIISTVPSLSPRQ